MIDFKQLVVLSITFLSLAGMFVFLAANDADTAAFGSFVVAAIVPTIAAVFGAKNAKDAKDAAKSAEKNTNGALHSLIQTLTEQGVIEDVEPDDAPHEFPESD